MANPISARGAVANAGSLKSAVTTVESLLKSDMIKARFDSMLGKKSGQFMSSIISAINLNPSLRACDPMTVISAAAIAASLDLPINPSLGFAHMVPYKKDGVSQAQFQMGWKGYVQLAMRTSLYEKMNASEVYEDEIESYNPITGEIKFTDIKEWKLRDKGRKDKIVGFCSFFRLLNGFQMFLYMKKSQVEAHAKEYSKSYSSEYGNWKKRFDSMARKTLIKLLLSKWGVLSVEMQKAITTDQAVTLEGGAIEYPDAIDAPGTVEEPDKETPKPAKLPDAPKPETDTPRDKI